MSDITVINDSEQSSLVTNGLAKNGELYLKASGSTNAGAIVVYDSGSWRTFANEFSPGGLTISTLDTEATILASSPTNPSGEVTVAYATDTTRLCVYDSVSWVTYDNNFTI
jgi:hypothetical protein